MIVNKFALLLVGNQFFQAYMQSDWFGRLIFILLIAASVCCWTLLIYDVWTVARAKRHATEFREAFKKLKNPLHFDQEAQFKKQNPNPYFELYSVLKKNCIEILNKNQRFGSQDEGVSYLGSSDVDCIASHLVACLADQTKGLEKNLFILSTIVGLGPLLGLLGTVWGILITFSGLQAHAAIGTNQMVLGGISLALTTTVLGLFTAIPALIAYNYLKNAIHTFDTQMEGFANEMLTAVEMQYRKVDFKG